MINRERRDVSPVVHNLLHSMRFAFAVGGAVIFVVSVLAYILAGWLGIGLVGLMGLSVSARLELHDGNAIADFDYGASSVHMLARQIEQQRNANPQQRDQLDRDRRRRKQLIYLLNTLWLAMMALGLVMFSTHQI